MCSEVQELIATGSNYHVSCVQLTLATYSYEKTSLFRVAAKAMFCRAWCNFSFSSARVVLWRWCSNSLALRSGGDGPSTLRVCGVGCFRTCLCVFVSFCFFVCSFACSSVGSMNVLHLLVVWVHDNVEASDFILILHSLTCFDLTDISLFVALLEVAEIYEESISPLVMGCPQWFYVTCHIRIQDVQPAKANHLYISRFWENTKTHGTVKMCFFCFSKKVAFMTNY